jgi:hypothetical protein
VISKPKKNQIVWHRSSPSEEGFDVVLMVPRERKNTKAPDAANRMPCPELRAIKLPRKMEESAILCFLRDPLYVIKMSSAPNAKANKPREDESNAAKKAMAPPMFCMIDTDPCNGFRSSGAIFPRKNPAMMPTYATSMMSSNEKSMLFVYLFYPA